MKLNGCFGYKAPNDSVRPTRRPQPPWKEFKTLTVSKLSASGSSSLTFTTGTICCEGYEDGPG
jgi:hypothetical protein